MEITKKLLVLIAVFAVYCRTIRGVRGQYGGYHMGQKGGYSADYGGYSGEEQSSNEVDERPRVQLGVRLRIPAFRFELPRVNLPKITISAKIRQPDRPRTINLPEINLDTSSKVSAPGLGTLAGQTQMTSDNGGYNAASAYNKPTYQHWNGGNPGEIVNHFSFSTSEEASAKKYPKRNPKYGYKQASTEYSSSQIQPSYTLADQNSHLNSNNHYQSRDPDLGFNAPVNVDSNMLSEQSSKIHNSNQMMPYRMIASKSDYNHIESKMQANQRYHGIGFSRYTNQPN